MKKLLKILLLAALVLLAMCLFAGCGGQEEEELAPVTLSEVYAVTDEAPQSITVSADGAYVGQFTIYDGQTIVEIMALLSARTYYPDTSGVPVPPGTGQVMMTLNYAQEDISLSMYSLTYDGDRYNCANDGLEALLVEIGLEDGALAER